MVNRTRLRGAASWRGRLDAGRLRDRRLREGHVHQAVAERRFAALAEVQPAGCGSQQARGDRDRGPWNACGATVGERVEHVDHVALATDHDRVVDVVGRLRA